MKSSPNHSHEKPDEYRMTVKELNTIFLTLEKEYLSVYRAQYGYLSLKEVKDIPWEQFCQKIGSIRPWFSSMSYPKQKIAILKALKILNDTHTTIRSDNRKQSPLFHFSFQLFPDGLFFTKIIGQKNVVGNKITTINGIAIEKILKQLLEITPYRNTSFITYKIPQLLRDIDILKWLGIVDSSWKIIFGYIDKNGHDNTIDVWNITCDIVKEEEKKNYTYNFDIQTKTTIFTYNKCREDELYLFADFTEDIIFDLKEKKSERIVIDVRANEGGSSLLFNQFLSQLKNTDVFEKGQIICLIGKSTFSSGVDVAYKLFVEWINKEKLNNELKKYQIADEIFWKTPDSAIFEQLEKNGCKLKTYIDLCHKFNIPKKVYFLGEDTGWEPKHFGATKTIEITPDLTLQYSTKNFTCLYGDTFSPDETITTTSEDYFLGVDKVMDRATQLKF